MTNKHSGKHVSGSCAENQRCVYLIDASIYIFRAWYSIPATLTNPAGEPINAVHGFAGFLAGFLREVEPRYVAVVFDESLTTSFRNDIYPEYKANRESPPQELRRQFADCRRLCAALGLADFASMRYEADDLINTVAKQLRSRNFAAVILSADKDLAQLLEAGDVLWDYARKRRHTHDTVRQWLGVEPCQVADWLALTGDPVDNIPGVPGIGAKTAATLLAQFGSLDRLYADLDIVAGCGLRGAAHLQQLLATHARTVRLARRLTGIATDRNLRIGVRDVQRRKVTADELAALCTGLGLGRNIQSRLLTAIGARAGTVGLR